MPTWEPRPSKSSRLSQAKGRWERVKYVPLVMALLVTSVTSFSDTRALGRLGARTITIFLALLAGAAVVLKPSEITPRHVDPLLAAVEELPALAAVVAVVRGPGRTGDDLIDHVDAVAFTGSVRSGRLVAKHAAERFIPAFLELGGNDPAIVMPSADVEQAAATLLRGSIAATGQACQSVERIYVHESIFEQFVRCLADGARRVRFNYPDIMSGNIGPLIFARQADVIREHLDEAVARGARIVAGGNIVDLGGGLYCEATVLTHTDHTMKVVMEETFGPIMPVMSFRSADEAVRLANDSVYGLSASVWSKDTAGAALSKFWLSCCINSVLLHPKQPA